MYHSECLWKWVNKTTVDTSLNVTCPLCRAFIDAATSEQLTRLYNDVKKIRNKQAKERAREAEAARVALVQEEKEKEKIAAATLAAELAARKKQKQEEQTLRLAQEEKMKRDRRAKTKQNKKEKKKREKERAEQLKQERKKQAALRKMGKEAEEQKREDAQMLYMRKQREENALRQALRQELINKRAWEKRHPIKLELDDLWFDEDINNEYESEYLERLNRSIYNYFLDQMAFFKKLKSDEDTYRRFKNGAYCSVSRNEMNETFNCKDGVYRCEDGVMWRLESVVRGVCGWFVFEADEDGAEIEDCEGIVWLYSMNTMYETPQYCPCSLDGYHVRSWSTGKWLKFLNYHHRF
jgi:hypothetical protein